MGRRRTDIEPRIVAAARARFLREGVDGASLRAIAADAGTSIGMVYYYFKTKDDLFLAVVESTYGKLVGDLTAATMDDVPPAERMRRLYRRIGAIDELEQQTVRLVIREALVSSKRLRKLVARFQRGHIPLVLATLRDGIADRAIRDDLPPWVLLVVTFAIGAVPQFALRTIGERVGYTGPHGDALADNLVDILFNGIGGDA
jgi:AcrR family transcriptional regulator